VTAVLIQVKNDDSASAESTRRSVFDAMNAPPPPPLQVSLCLKCEVAASFKGASPLRQLACLFLPLASMNTIT